MSVYTNMNFAEPYIKHLSLYICTEYEEAKKNFDVENFMLHM